MFPGKNVSAAAVIISDGTFDIHFWLVYAASPVLVHAFFTGFKKWLWGEPSRIWIPTIPHK
jgi:hypothetical protein